MNTQLEDIEAKIAYQEHTIQELSDVIYKQQKQIETLERTCQRIIERITELADIGPTSKPQDEKPPHY